MEDLAINVQKGSSQWYRVRAVSVFVSELELSRWFRWGRLVVGQGNLKAMVEGAGHVGGEVLAGVDGLEVATHLQTTMGTNRNERLAMPGSRVW